MNMRALRTPIAPIFVLGLEGQILRTLRLRSMTRPELCNALLRPRTSVQSAIDELASRDLVRSDGQRKASRGAPATLWKIAA